MNDIQKAINIIEKVEVNFCKALLYFKVHEMQTDVEQTAFALQEFAFVKQVLGSFLKSANGSNHTGCANSANTLLGEVPPENDLQQSESAGADCSETGAVGQNEQEKEHFIMQNCCCTDEQSAFCRNAFCSRWMK